MNSHQPIKLGGNAAGDERCSVELFGILNQGAFLFAKHDSSEKQKEDHMVKNKLNSIIRIESLIANDESRIMEQLISIDRIIDKKTKELLQLEWDQALLESYLSYNKGNYQLAMYQLKGFLTQPNINIFMVTEYDVGVYLAYMAKYALAAKEYNQAAEYIHKAMTYRHNSSDWQLLEVINEVYEALQSLGIDEAHFKQFKISLKKQYEDILKSI